MSWADLNLMPAMPEIVLLIAVSAILIIDLFVKGERRGMTYLLSMLALVATGAATLAAWLPYPVLTFSGMYVADPIASVAKLGLVVATGVAMIYARQYAFDRGFLKGELFTLMLFALLGMCVMVSASHMLTLYIGLELLSLALYALIALSRESVPATEAAMKYFVLGALASGLLLYGVSMVYGGTQSLHIVAVAQSIASGNANVTLVSLGLVFIVAGLAFKLGAVPFHMWVPDVYQGAPTAVTLFVGSAPKLAAFVFVIRFLAQALEPAAVAWQPMLILLAIASLVVGNLAAIMQTNIKRMLAYSTISHMGFMLIGILAATPAGYSAAMFYAITYMLMALAGFGVLLALSRAGFDCETLDDLKGLNRKNAWYALLMLLVMFSMAGIPPLVGFYAKFAVLEAAVNVGLTWLAVVGVVMSLIGAFYYLRVVKTVYFDEATGSAGDALTVGGDMKLVLGVNGLVLLGLGILPNGLYTLCLEAVRQSLGTL